MTPRGPGQGDDLLAGHGERAPRLDPDVTDHAGAVAALGTACGQLRADFDAREGTTLGADDPDHRRTA